MANSEITNVDRGSVLLDGQAYSDETLVFAAADTFVAGTILARLTSNSKLVPFDPGGTGGAEAPLMVLTYDATRASAGDLKIRALSAGVVNRNRLIIDVDGDGDNITPAILDQLRAAGVIAHKVEQLSVLDNQ